MKVNVIVISTESTDKTVGVMLHDPASGRVLLKVRPSDQSLMQTFALWQARPLIEQIRQEVRGRKLTRRLRAVPTDDAYGSLLVDRFVKKPYRVRFSSVMDLTSLDHSLDTLYANFVDQARKPEEKSPFSLGWSHTFGKPQG